MISGCHQHLFPRTTACLPKLFARPAKGLDGRDAAFMEGLRNLAREALTWEHLSDQQALGVGRGAGVGRRASAGDWVLGAGGVLVLAG